LAREVFSPAWLSVGVLLWLSAMAAAAGATLMWRTLGTFALVLDLATATALERSAYVLAATSILCLVLALLRRRAPRARGLWASLLAILVVSSVAALLALRGRGTPPLLEARPIDAAFDMARNERSPRVTVLAIDAGSLDLITGATAEGRLPNFGRILDAGARGAGVSGERHLSSGGADRVWHRRAVGHLPAGAAARGAGGDGERHDRRPAGGDGVARRCRRLWRRPAPGDARANRPRLR